MIKDHFIVPVLEGIQKVEKLMTIQADGHHLDVSEALKYLLSSGGKRIRVVITLLTGGMLRADPDRLITLAAAIEMLHTATLVHDDLIDSALIRRGIPTINSQWTPAATVLTGDFFFARAAKLAAETESIAVMKLFADTLTVIVNGEISQLFTKSGVSTREDYDRRIYAKTASLFETAATSAAILSGRDESIIHKLGRYGYDVGMAFQIMDDVLDFTGDQETFGKPIGSDLQQGIMTLPSIYYFQEHPSDPVLQAIIHREVVSKEDINRLIIEIRESEAIHQAVQDAKRFANQGKEALMNLPDCIERRSLEDLALFTISRNL